MSSLETHRGWKILLFLEAFVMGGDRGRPKFSGIHAWALGTIPAVDYTAREPKSKGGRVAPEREGGEGEIQRR